MMTFAEIKAAVDTLTMEQKRELVLFLARRLRAGIAELPPVRKFSQEEIAAWVAEDEADAERLRQRGD